MKMIWSYLPSALRKLFAALDRLRSKLRRWGLQSLRHSVNSMRAYLRYASVYRNFASLEDFEGEIALLRALPSIAATDSQVKANQANQATNSLRESSPKENAVSK
jgi:hypothetical protein